MPQTFTQFIAENMATMFPLGVADNLKTQVEGTFADALIDLQRWVKCLQQHNTTVVGACNTYWDCGLTVAEAPKGRFKRVYTIANDDWCDKVQYTPARYGDVREASKNLINVVAPPDRPQLVPLPGGVKYADSSSDDLAQGRARRGDYAIHNGRIYVMPWLQSNEKLVIEWDGIKQLWGNDDLVDFDPATKTAVQLYVRAQYFCDFTQDQASFAKYNALYESQRADLMYECRQETQVTEVETPEHYLPTGAQIRDDAP